MLARNCFPRIVGSSSLVLALATALPAHGAIRTWVGMNHDWDASAANWNPADEPDADDTANFVDNVSVKLANPSESVNTLFLLGGVDLDLNGNDMTVDGVVSLFGANVNLLVGPAASTLSADRLVTSGGASLVMRGGALTINDEADDGLLDIRVGGDVSGHGFITFTDSVAPGTTVLSNDGVLSATSTAFDVAGTTASTLRLTSVDADAGIDLDGSDAAESGVLTVFRNDTLYIDMPLSDKFFDGDVILSAGATLVMTHSWTLRTGEIKPNTAGIAMETAGDAATIAGADLIQSLGAIALDAIDSLHIVCEYYGTGGVIDNNGGKLYFDGGAHIEDGVLVNLIHGALLQGNGWIYADVHGSSSDGSAEKLLADNGTLHVHGDFSNVIVGTADVDGVFFVPYAKSWNTDATNGVSLAGGELRGGQITNDLAAGIRGHGLITARVINETQIVAEGGKLVIQDASGSDWGGVSGAGVLKAAAGDLELTGSPGMAFFDGTVVAAANREVFTNGLGLRFLPQSALELHSGSHYRTTWETYVEGRVSVAKGGAATLEGPGIVTFRDGCTVLLDSDLLLENARVNAYPGAKFSGDGAVVVGDDSTLVLVDGLTSANLAVRIVNSGMMRLGGSPAGQVEGLEYEQTAEGRWRLEVRGPGPTDFDQLTLTGSAELDGTLDLMLDGFMPSLGQTYDVLSAAGGVSGVFATIVQPPDMPAGLHFDVIYHPTLVQLEVVGALAFTADFDGSGAVDAADLAIWQDAFARNANGDSDGDGDSDGADFLAWQRQLGSGLPAPVWPVPEPGSLYLLLISGWQVTRFHRRRPAIVPTA
jgi:hypothetical protein